MNSGRLCRRTPPAAGRWPHEFPGCPPVVLDVIRHHHEHWDGSAYPDCLAGNEIPFLARVVAVCDVYDALISDRHYKKA
ncbi:HD domain-containing phosphohydrolase (plasmid) [Deinococcus radiomollis]